MWAAVRSAGMVFLPEVGDEVLVAFDHGFFDRPVVIAGLFNGKDEPGGGWGEHVSSRGVDRRRITSRTGMRIEFVEDGSTESVQLTTNDGAQRITVRQNGEKGIEIVSEGPVSVTAKQDVSVKTDSGNVTIKGAQGVDRSHRHARGQGDAAEPDRDGEGAAVRSSGGGEGGCRSRGLGERTAHPQGRNREDQLRIDMSKEFVGRGWSFPVEADRSGRIKLTRDDREIEDSIRLILATSPGERPMRPEFGCAVHEYVFAPADASTAGAIGDAVRTSLAVLGAEDRPRRRDRRLRPRGAGTTADRHPLPHPR